MAKSNAVHHSVCVHFLLHTLMCDRPPDTSPSLRIQNAIVCEIMCTTVARSSAVHWDTHHHQNVTFCDIPGVMVSSRELHQRMVSLCRCMCGWHQLRSQLHRERDARIKCAHWARLIWLLWLLWLLYTQYIVWDNWALSAKLSAFCECATLFCVQQNREYPFRTANGTAIQP